MADILDHFKNSRRIESYPAGTTIFEADDFGDVMYAVQAGEVDIIVDGAVVETVGEGGIFGEMGLINNFPRAAAAVAKTDCRLVPVDEYHFYYLISETPTFALQVMQAMADRMRRAWESK
jgi:CRP/FNR family cyclic AMP-dependent transcriptional regulator